MKGDLTELRDLFIQCAIPKATGSFPIDGRFRFRKAFFSLQNFEGRMCVLCYDMSGEEEDGGMTV